MSGKGERLVHLLRWLLDRPATLLSLSDFSERLGVAKSTLSEDLATVREALDAAGLGRLETHPGAAGGIVYWPTLSRPLIDERVERLCRLLADPDRVLSGGFLYLTDVVFSPEWSVFFGEAVLSHFHPERPDCVLTVETRGVPLGLGAARAFGVPLAVARHQGRVSEGPSVNINFFSSGAERRLRTMSLSRRAIRRGDRVLIVDDFMRGGGTARGMVDLVQEFEATVFGLAFLIETGEPEQKLVQDYLSIVRLLGVDETARRVEVRPSGRIAPRTGDV